MLIMYIVFSLSLLYAYLCLLLCIFASSFSLPPSLFPPLLFSPLRKYYRSVVPHLLYNDHDSLQSVSNATLLSKEDLIKECLPVTMASILTATAVREGDEDAKQQAKAAHDFIVSVITRETLNSSLKHSLPLLVVELLTRLYEPPNSDSPLAKYSK